MEVEIYIGKDWEVEADFGLEVYFGA